MSSRTCPAKERALEEHGLVEADLVGGQSDDAPRVPSGRLCNAKKTENHTGVFQGYCRAYSGQGTENEDGRCKSHSGASPKAPEGNQHAQKHALTADPKKYADNLPHEEGEWIRDISASLEDRIRHNKGSIDPLDRVLSRRVAIRLHIASHATEYVQDEGLIETIWTDEGRMEVKNRLLEELRQFDKDIVNDLKKLGVLDDPESKKADAIAEWKEFVDAN